MVIVGLPYAWQGQMGLQEVTGGTPYGASTVAGVHERGTTAANTMYSIKQHDHHPGEPAVVHHSGKALTRAGQ